VNGIEWCGRRFNLGATAVGSVLAAFGTALPESAVTVTAVVFGRTPADRDLGVGAAMGGPLALATVAYAVVGAALILHRRRLGRPSHQVKVDHIISPVATKLPETMNALIWVRQGKERLALANISGAMMIQATIPSALGIFFSPWLFDSTLLASGVITAVSILFLWALFHRGSVDGRAHWYRSVCCTAYLPCSSRRTPTTEPKPPIDFYAPPAFTHST